MANWLHALTLSLAGLALSTGVARANDIYIAQTAAGSANGSSCANAYAYSFFNTSSNWGAGLSQIGPGKTVHLCGTLTFPAGTSGLMVQDSGTSGNVITVLFEAGAVFQSPAFSNGSTGGGGIAIGSHSYITIDGGSTGIIQNTANGTGLTYATSSVGINATNSSNVTIQNLTCRNIYQRTSQADVLSFQHFDAACVQANPVSNLVIDNVVAHDAGSLMNLMGDNVTLSNSNLYRMDHGVSTGGVAHSGFYIYGNHFHDMANWDDASGGNNYHHDGIHIFQSSGSAVISNVYIYNNTFDGDPGSNVGCPSHCGPNAWIYVEPVSASGTVAIFNNTLTSSNSTTTFPSEIDAASGALIIVANNTVWGGGYSAGVACYFGWGNSTVSVFKNNICSGQAFTLAVNTDSILATDSYDYNVYADGSLLGNQDNFGYAGTNTNLLTTWRTVSLPTIGLGHDANSKLGLLSAINLTPDGHLNSDSIAIGAGTNLTSLCTGPLAPLCNDKNGSARPASGAWDSGAYQYAALASVNGEWHGTVY